MPVSTTAVIVSYPGDGLAAALPVPFQFDDPTHLKVTRVNADATLTVLTLNTDYTVTHAAPGDPGTVNMTAAPASGTTTRIERFTPVNQPDTLQNQGTMLAASLERLVNRSVMIEQELAARVISTDLTPLQNQVDTLAVNVEGKAGRDRPFVTIGADASLDNERRLAIAAPLTLADGGAGGAVTLGIDTSGLSTDTTLRTDLAASGSALVAHTAGFAGSASRLTSSKFDESVSITDFAGAAGDDTTDNAAAFSAAQASSAPRVYLPEGVYYTTSAASTLSKHYYGPGKIRTSGGDRLPGRFTYLTARPATGTGLDLNRYFSADLSKVEAEYFLLGNAANNVRKGINEPYYESATTPHFQVFTNRSGWSGITALLAGSVAAGATSATLNSVAGLAVNDVVIFLDAATETASAATTITAISGSTITFTPATTVAYAVNDRVTHGKRTMNPLYYQQVNHSGGGDAYAHMMRVNVSYAALAGQTHVFFTATGGLMGGDLSAESAGVFLTGTEINHNDNGFDVACIGDIRNFQRTNAAGARGAFWIGHQLKSEGSQPMDAGYNLVGKYQAGVDLVKGDFGAGQAAISMAAGHRIVFDSSATDMAGYSLVGNVIGDSYVAFNAANNRMEAHVNGAIAFTWTAALLATAGEIESGTHMSIPLGQRLNLEGRLGDTYLTFDGTSILLFKNGVQVASW